MGHMDINTSPVYAPEPVEYSPSAYVSQSKGIFAANANTFEEYQAQLLASEADSEVASATEVESVKYAFEVGSSSGEIVAKIPEGVFDFRFENEEQRLAYVQAVKAILDASESYMKYAPVNPDAEKYSVPNSPRSLSEMVFKFYEELKANGIPNNPFERPEMTGSYSGDQYTQEKVVIDGKEVILHCRIMPLVLGIEVCSPEPALNSGMLYLEDGRTVGTIIYAMSIVAQEFAVALPYLATRVGDIADTFRFQGSIEAYIQGVLSGRKDGVPTPPSTMPQRIVPSTTRA